MNQKNYTLWSTDIHTRYARMVQYLKISQCNIAHQQSKQEKSNYMIITINVKKKDRASLVAQWLRICLLVQGTRVRALVWEDPTCHGATGPVSHSCWACASGACAPQQERPRYCERPAHRDEEWPPLAATRESPRTETKTQHSHK